MHYARPSFYLKQTTIIRSTGRVHSSFFNFSWNAIKTPNYTSQLAKNNFVFSSIISVSKARIRDGKGTQFSWESANNFWKSLCPTFMFWVLSAPSSTLETEHNCQFPFVVDFKTEGAPICPWMQMLLLNVHHMPLDWWNWSSGIQEPAGRRVYDAGMEKYWTFSIVKSLLSSFALFIMSP